MFNNSTKYDIYYRTERGLITKSELSKFYTILFGERPDKKQLADFSYVCRGIKGALKNPSISELLDYNERNKAIKLYRETYDVPLTEAKARIDEMLYERGEGI